MFAKKGFPKSKKAKIKKILEFAPQY